MFLDKLSGHLGTGLTFFQPIILPVRKLHSSGFVIKKTKKIKKKKNVTRRSFPHLSVESS